MWLCGILIDPSIKSSVATPLLITLPVLEKYKQPHSMTPPPVSLYPWSVQADVKCLSINTFLAFPVGKINKNSPSS